MTFFLDANVIVYAWVPSEHREACLEVLEAIVARDADGRTSTAALEEVWHLELSGRAGDLHGLAERAYAVLTPLLPVTDDAFLAALTLDAPRLGANDRLHVGTCQAHGIDTVLSADLGFDALPGVRRVDPLDERARRALLSA